MKLLFPFIILLFTVSIFSQETTALQTVYKDSEYSFSISFPKSWLQSPKDPDPDILLKALSENGLGTANFNIVVNHVPSSIKITAEDLVKIMFTPESLNKLAQKKLQEAKVTSSGKSYLGGKQAYYFIYEGNYENHLVKFYQSQTYFKSNIFTITFGSTKSEFDEYYPIFKEIVSSFAFIPNNVKVTPSKKAPPKKN